jgi:hypothetical protein
MSRPSKKDIKAALDKLREKPTGQSDGGFQDGGDSSKLSDKKSSQRIRKQGV